MTLVLLILYDSIAFYFNFFFLILYSVPNKIQEICNYCSIAAEDIKKKLIIDNLKINVKPIDTCECEFYEKFYNL